MRHKGQFVTKRVGKQLPQIKALWNKRAVTKTDREADTPTSSFTFEGRQILESSIWGTWPNNCHPLNKGSLT